MADTLTAEQTREIPCSVCGVDAGELCIDPDTKKVRTRNGQIKNHMQRVKDRRALAADRRMNQRRLTNTGQ